MGSRRVLLWEDDCGGRRFEGLKGFLETLEVAGISFEDAAADRQAASDDHNRRETALYAQSLERKALARN